MYQGDRMPQFTLRAVLMGLGLGRPRPRRRPKNPYRVPIASGLLAGESLMKAILAMAATAIRLL
jgi:hypothetical protein